MVEPILIGVASSIIASCVFLLALYLIRPNIEIVENIAKDVALNGKTFYVFKVINRARRTAVDVRAELRLTTYKNVDNGHVVVTQSIQLTQPEIFSISRYKKGKTGCGYRFSHLKILNEYGLMIRQAILALRSTLKIHSLDLERFLIRNFAPKTRLLYLASFKRRKYRDSLRDCGNGKSHNKLLQSPALWAGTSASPPPLNTGVQCPHHI